MGERERECVDVHCCVFPPPPPPRALYFICILAVTYAPLYFSKYWFAPPPPPPEKYKTLSHYPLLPTLTAPRSQSVDFTPLHSPSSAVSDFNSITVQNPIHRLPEPRFAPIPGGRVIGPHPPGHPGNDDVISHVNVQYIVYTHNIITCIHTYNVHVHVHRAKSTHAHTSLTHTHTHTHTQLMFCLLWHDVIMT